MVFEHPRTTYTDSLQARVHVLAPSSRLHTSLELELCRRMYSCGGRHRRRRRGAPQQSAGSRLTGTSRYSTGSACRALLLGLLAIMLLSPELLMIHGFTASGSSPCIRLSPHIPAHHWIATVAACSCFCSLTGMCCRLLCCRLMRRLLLACPPLIGADGCRRGMPSSSAGTMRGLLKNTRRDWRLRSQIRRR